MLAKAQEWAKDIGRTDTLPSFYSEATRMRNLLNDYDAKEATTTKRAEEAAKRTEETATADREQGDVQSREAANEFAQSRADNDHAARVDHDGPPQQKKPGTATCSSPKHPKPKKNEPKHQR